MMNNHMLPEPIEHSLLHRSISSCAYNFFTNAPSLYHRQQLYLFYKIMLMHNPECVNRMESLSKLSQEFAAFLNSLPLLYRISATRDAIYQAQRQIEDRLETHPLIIKYGKRTKPDHLDEELNQLIDHLAARGETGGDIHSSQLSIQLQRMVDKYAKMNFRKYETTICSMMQFSEHYRLLYDDILFFSCLDHTITYHD